MCAPLHLCEPLPETFMNHLSPDRQLAFLVAIIFPTDVAFELAIVLFSFECFLDLRLYYGQILPTIKVGSICPTMKEGDIWGKPRSQDPGSRVDASPQVWSLYFSSSGIRDVYSQVMQSLCLGSGKNELKTLPRRSFLLIPKDILLLLEHSCC